VYESTPELGKKAEVNRLTLEASDKPKTYMLADSSISVVRRYGIYRSQVRKDELDTVYEYAHYFFMFSTEEYAMGYFMRGVGDIFDQKIAHHELQIRSHKNNLVNLENAERIVR
jgi:hypothetical protein